MLHPGRPRCPRVEATPAGGGATAAIASGIAIQTEVEAAKHYPALKTKRVEFLGERPSEETDREEEPVQAA